MTEPVFDLDKRAMEMPGDDEDWIAGKCYRLAEVFFAFEKYLYSTTDVRALIGGYVKVKYVSQDEKNLYADVHWGVDNSLESYDNVEHCYIPKSEAIKDASPEVRMRAFRYVPTKKED